MTTEATWTRGTTALVTGGARRLGKDICLALAAAGANVVVHYRESAAEAEALVQRLQECGVDAWTTQCDLADPTASEDFLSGVIKSYGPLDILVNNASIFPEDTLDTLTPDKVHENVDINALAPALLSRRFAAQKRAGAIINLLDSRMNDFDHRHLPYHLSKRMLYTLTRITAAAYAPLVRVNGVAPGLVLPPEGKDVGYLQSLAHTTPLQTHGAAEDISRTVLFLLNSPFITGQIIYVDGGRHLRAAMY